MEDTVLVSLSALQHWCYCPRQCALIHVEQVFSENIYTLRGRAVHESVDQPCVDMRPDVRIERALPLWCDRLGLIGKADVVEFASDGTPFPVEYKNGSRNKTPWIAACDELQLAAQALCLEEMTGVAVSAGALFYATSRRRRVVQVDAGLRTRVEKATREVRELLRKGTVPAPLNDDRCAKCSLYDLCQPKVQSDTAGLFVVDC